MADIERRRSLNVPGTAPLVGAVAGCLGGGDTGTSATRVSNRPGDVGDVDALRIQASAIPVTPDDDLRRIVAESQFDLTEPVGEASDLIDGTELDPGPSEFLKPDADVTDATLGDGSPATVTPPGEPPLNFDTAFDIRSGESTSFIADLTPDGQRQTGRSVRRPVADEGQVGYEDTRTPTSS